MPVSPSQVRLPGIELASPTTPCTQCQDDLLFPQLLLELELSRIHDVDTHHRWH